MWPTASCWDVEERVKEFSAEGNPLVTMNAHD